MVFLKRDNSNYDKCITWWRHVTLEKVNLFVSVLLKYNINEKSLALKNFFKTSDCVM